MSPGHLRAADRIFVDETRAPVLEPGRKATKSGYFWAVVSDDRGHGGAGPALVLFHDAPGRGREHPLRFLAGYRGRFLHLWATGSPARAAIGCWIAFYNHKRPHTAHGRRPPAVGYFNSIEPDQQAQAVA